MERSHPHMLRTIPMQLRTARSTLGLLGLSIIGAIVVGATITGEVDAYLGSRFSLVLLGTLLVTIFIVIFASRLRWLSRFPARAQRRQDARFARWQSSNGKHTRTTSTRYDVAPFVNHAAAISALDARGRGGRHRRRLPSPPAPSAVPPSVPVVARYLYCTRISPASVLIRRYE